MRFHRMIILQAELESSFIYQDTPDQSMATSDVKADMEQAHPMDRLVCGDVGFGKTEIAIRAAFKAVKRRKTSSGAGSDDYSRHATSPNLLLRQAWKTCLLTLNTSIDSKLQ